MRATLTPAENEASMNFEVALRMHNMAELQARAGRGERIGRAELAAKYEPPAADYAAVADWLTRSGFTITRRDSHHLAIFACGSVSQIESAFQVKFARVAYEGEEFTSAVSPPLIDPAIAPLILAINGLQPQIRAHKHSIKSSILATGANGTLVFIPSQLGVAYSATGLYNAGVTGAGQSIAIVIDRFPLKTDLTSFWQVAGVNQSLSNIFFITVTGTGTNATPEGEESLDTEWSSSIAPGVQVRVYATSDLEDGDLDAAYIQINDDATDHPEYGLNQMSMSYGGGEQDTSLGQAQTDDGYFAALAVSGVTLFASSGDAGSTPGDNSATDESGPLQVENPASDPNVTGVGGTLLTLNADNTENSETVWNEGSGGASGGGASIYFSRPAWQTGPGVPAGSTRLVPDVCCPADPKHGALVYLNGKEYRIGGTSWSSPTWAGFCALINQNRANAGLPSLGALNQYIYPLIGTANFRDIVSGNNATANSDGLYVAGVGYDETTGIGSPLVQALAQTLTPPPAPETASDTPTLPAWALLALGLVLAALALPGEGRLKAVAESTVTQLKG